MKYYKYLGFAVLFGILCYWGYRNTDTEIMFSKIIMCTTYEFVDFYPEHIMQIMHWYIPILIFHIMFGTYIYRYFCESGIYYFTRIKNRKIWFLKKIRELYIFVVCYLMVMLATGTIVFALKTKISFDKTSIILLFYYLIIYSAFLFVTTLGINVLSIRFSSIMAFSTIEGIMIGSITIFTLLGKIVEDEMGIIEKNIWILKINPFSNLVFSMHSSFLDEINLLINKKGICFDLNNSVYLWLALVMVALIYGVIVIEQYEFITNNKELSG